MAFRNYKLCQPCFRKVKTVIEFRSLSLASLSKQELSIKATGMKIMCASQQVGDSPSSSQQTKKSAISVNHEGGDSVRMCLFANGGQNHKSQVPPVCFGYAVLMYQRNSKLGMLQKLLSILLGSGGCSRRIFTCLNAIESPNLRRHG
ncbi:uncharacterized protein LOC144662469 [Oculina patagonica]